MAASARAASLVMPMARAIFFRTQQMMQAQSAVSAKKKFPMPCTIWMLVW